MFGYDVFGSPLKTFRSEDVPTILVKIKNGKVETPINFFKSDFAADTSKDVPADAGKETIEVKWYDNVGKYFWDRSTIGYSGYASTGKTSADAVASWLRNTLSATQGMGVKFLSLAPWDTAQPIDCEMFAWGPWSNWSEWGDCQDGTQTRTRTKTRSVKTAAANGGTACPTDLEQTETDTQTCGGGGTITTMTSSCSDSNRETNSDGSCGTSCKSGYEFNTSDVCVPIEDTEEGLPWGKIALVGGVAALLILR